MRILSAIMAVILTFSFSGVSYCEVILDKPFNPITAAKLLRSPSEIIADFQASVDKIQVEHQTLYSEIETKNKENTFLLKKINDLSVQLLQLDYSLSKKSTQTIQENPVKIKALEQEKDILLKKYDEALAQKLALVQEIKRLSDNKQSVDDQRQSGLETVREALSSAEGQIKEQKTAMQTVIREKEAIDQKHMAAIEEKAVLQERLRNLELQMKEAQSNEANKTAGQQGPLQQRIRQLSDRLDQMQESLREKDGLISSSKSYALKAQSDLRKIQQERDDLKEQIRKVTATYTAAQDGRSGKITRLELELKEKKDEIKRLSDENSRIQKNMPTLEAERRVLSDQIVALNDNLRKEQSSLEVKVQNAKAPVMLQVGALQKTLDAKNSDLQNKHKEIDALKEKSDALAKQLADAQKERDSFRASVGSLEEKLKKTSQVSGAPEQAAQEQIKFLKEDIAKRDTQIKTKSEMIDELEGQKKELLSLVEKTNQEKEILQKAMQAYKDQLKDGNAQTDAKSEEAQKTFEDKIASLTSDLKLKDGRITEKESQIEQLLVKQNEVSLKLQDNGREKNALQETIESLKDQLKAVRTDHVNSSDHAKESISEVEDLKNNLKARAKDLEETKIRTQQLEKELRNAASERQRFEDETASLKIKLKEQESLGETKSAELRVSLEDKIEKLNTQLSDQSKEVSNKEKLLSDSSIEKQIIEASLKKTEDERDGLETKVIDLEKALEIFKSGQSNATAQLLKLSEEENDVLTKNLQDARKAITAKDESINDLQRKNTKFEQQAKSSLKEKSSAEETVKKLNDQLKILKEESGQKIANIETDTKRQIAQAQKFSADTKQALKIKEDLVAGLNNKISNTDLQIIRLTDEGTKLRSNVERLNKEKAGVEQELTDARKLSYAKSDGQDKPTGQLQAKIGSLESDRAGLKAKLDEAAKEKDNLKKELETLRQQKEVSRKNINDGSKAQAETIATLNLKNSELEARLADVTGRSKTLETTVGDLQSQISLLRKNSPAESAAIQTRLQEKINALSADLQESTDQTKIQDKLAREFKEKNIQLNVALEASQKSIIEKDQSISELTAAKKELTVQVSGLGKDRESLDAKVRNLTLQLNELQAAQSGQITSVKSQATQKTADLAMKLADAVGQTRSSEMLVQQLAEKTKNLEQQLAAAGTLKAQSDEALKKSQLETENLRKDYEFDRRRMKEDIFRYGTERDSQIIKVNELQNILKDQEKISKSSLDDARKQVIDEIETLRALAREKDAQLQSAGARNKEFEQIKEKLNQQLADAQLKQKENDAKILQLQGVISEKETKRREAATSVEKELTTKLDEATAQLRTSQTETIELRKSKDILQENLKTAETKAAQLQAEKTDKEKALATVQAQSSEEIATTKKTLETQVQQLTEELKSSQQFVAELTKTKKSSEESLKEKEARITELQAGTVEKEKALTALQAQLSQEIAAARKTSETKAGQLSEELKSLQQTIAELTKTKKSLEETLNTKETKIAQLEVERADKEKALVSVQSQAKEEIIASKKTLEAQVEQLTGELKGLQKAVVDLTKSKNGLQENLKTAETKAAQLQAEKTDKEKALATVQAQSSEEIATTKKTLETQVQQLTEELKSSQQFVAELTKTKKSSEESLKEKEARITELQAGTVEKEKALTAVQLQAKKDVTAAKKMLEVQVPRLTGELKSSQQTVVELTKSKNNLEEMINSSNVKLAQMTQDTTDKIAKLEKALKEEQLASKVSVEESRKQLVGEIEALKIAAREKDSQLQKEVAWNKELEQAKNGLTEQLTAAQSKQKENESKIAQLQGAAASKEAQSQDAMASMEKELKAKIGEITAHLSASQTQAAELKKSKSSLEENLKAKETKMAQLEIETSKNTKALATTRAQAKEEIAAAKKALDSQVQQLTGKLKGSQEAVVELTKVKEALEASVKSFGLKIGEAAAVISKKEVEIQSLQNAASAAVVVARKPLEEKIDILVKSLGDAQSELKIKQGVMDGLSAKVSGLEKSLSEASTARTRSEKESLEAKTALEKTRKDISFEIEKANKPLLEKNQALRVTLDENNAKITSLTLERDRLSGELASVSSEVKKLQQETAVLKGEIGNQKRTLEEEIASAKQPFLVQIAELQKILNDKEQLIAQKAEAFTKVSGELSTVLKGLAVIREERDNLSVSVKPLEAKVNAMPQEIAFAKKPLEEENARLKVEVEKVQGMLDVRVKGLEADLDAKNAAYNEMVSGRRDFEKEMASITQESGKLSQENKRLELKLSKKFQEECGVAMEELQKPWKDKIDDLKSQLDGRDKEIESMKNENVRLNQELSNSAPATK